MSTARVIPFATDPSGSSPAMERYENAYHISKTAANFADTVSNVGTFLAGVIFVVALVVFQSFPDERSGFPVISVSLMAGAVLVVLASRLWATIFRVQGRMLQIATDSAVHSSPWLSHTQRARIMALPNEPVNEGKAQKTAA